MFNWTNCYRAAQFEVCFSLQPAMSDASQMMCIMHKAMLQLDTGLCKAGTHIGSNTVGRDRATYVSVANLTCEMHTHTANTASSAKQLHHLLVAFWCTDCSMCIHVSWPWAFYDPVLQIHKLELWL